MSARPSGKRGSVGVVLGLVLLGVLVGLALVGQDRWRRGLNLIGASLVLAAALRLVLPVRRVGLLAVRTRPVDVAVLGALGVGIIVVTASVPLPTG